MKAQKNNSIEVNGRLSTLLQLLPGLAPLFLYIIIDSIFGEKIGILTAVVFGTLEFVIILIKERHTDFFVLADTGLLVVLGIISLVLETPLMVKSKPAVFEFIAAALFFLLAVLPQQKSSAFIRRILRAKELPVIIPAVFCWIISAVSVIHAVFVFIAAAYLSNFWWITAVTSYYFLPLLILIPVLIRKILYPVYMKIRYSKDEWFNIVTPEGRIVGEMPRTLCHKGPGLLHPVVHLFVFNKEGHILLQKRSTKKNIQPGKWDTSVGGHVMAGETIEHALYREAEEEIGITGFSPVVLHRYVWEYEIESELVFSFAAEYDGSFSFNTEEIDEISFFTSEEILHGNLDLTPNLRHEMDLILPLISKETEKIN